MMEIELTDRFKNSYAELPEQIKKKVQKAIRLLANDPRIHHYKQSQFKELRGSMRLVLIEHTE